MNMVIETIKARRSVRAYKPDPIPREHLGTIIEAGNWAPSGLNRQPWRFVVVESAPWRARLLAAARPAWRRVVERWITDAGEELRAELTALFPRSLGWPEQPYEVAMRGWAEMEDGVYWSAPVVVFVVCTSGTGASKGCAAVCQNMMLAARSLGIGSCWVGFGTPVRDDPEILEALELQEGESISDCLVFGYPAIDPAPPRKKPPVVKWL